MGLMSDYRAIQLASNFGFMTVDEVVLFQSICRKVVASKPVFINIGSGAGTSGLAMVEARPEATVYTIDISEGGPLGGLENERNAFAPYPELKLPVQILNDSSKAGREWALEKPDLVFVDAGHLKHEVEADIMAWKPQLKMGGYMMFHDYGSKHWPDVMEVVNAMVIPDMRFISVVDTLAVAQKIR